MMNNDDNIQLVLSKLITNPRCLMRCLNDPTGFVKEIFLPDECREKLIDFIGKHSHEFLSSSLFLARKRFLAIMDSLYVYRKMKSLDDLDIFWTRYLSTYRYGENAPKNPMYESVSFCRYIRDFERISVVEKLVLDYEIARNSVILDYNTWPHSYNIKPFKDSSVILSQMKTNKFFVHPCSRVYEFIGNISDILKIRNKENFAVEVVNMHKGAQEEIMFFKNYNNGKVTSIKMTPNLKVLIKILSLSTSIEGTFIDFKNSGHIKNHDEFVEGSKNLLKLGICSILPLNQGGIDYV